MSSTKDVNYKSYVAESGITVDQFTPPENPMDYSDILKFSNCVKVIIKNLVIPGGKEDALDCVRGSFYLATNCVLNGSITIKGAIDGFILQDCHVAKKIEIGQFDNYWTAGRAPTRNIKLFNVQPTEGSKPVTVLVWDGERPEVVNSNVRVIKIPKIIWFPYFFFRRLYLKRTGVIK